MFLVCSYGCAHNVMVYVLPVSPTLCVCDQMAAVNTSTMHGVSGMTFLSRLDWGLLPDNLVGTDAEAADPNAVKDSIPFLSSWEAIAEKDGVGKTERGDGDTGDIVRVNINRLVEKVCSCLCDTTIRVFKVPKAFTA